LPAGCLTKGRNGKVKADFNAMARAGAVAFTDDGTTVANDELLLDIMLSLHVIDKPLFDHAMDPCLAGNGVIREGQTAKKLRLQSIPAEAEYKIVKRDISLCEITNCHVHIQHLSTKESVKLLEIAQEKKLPVTAEVTPHHITLCTDDIVSDNANFKMNPPLGTYDDVKELRNALKKGIISSFATDHAPHPNYQKMLGFKKAPFGVIGLETAIGVTYSLVIEKVIDRMTWLRLWTKGPANILHLPVPAIQEGEPANLILLDLNSEWVVDPQKLASKSANTPFSGKQLIGRNVFTMFNGKICYDEYNLSK